MYTQREVENALVLLTTASMRAPTPCREVNRIGGRVRIKNLRDGASMYLFTAIYLAFSRTRTPVYVLHFPQTWKQSKATPLDDRINQTLSALNGCDYSLFSPRCPTCMETILSTDMVRLLGSVAYHADCFRCVLCARCLVTGDECRSLGDGVRFVCVEHDASATSQRLCHPGTPRSPSRSDSILEGSGGGGCGDRTKHEIGRWKSECCK